MNIREEDVDRLFHSFSEFVKTESRKAEEWRNPNEVSYEPPPDLTLAVRLTAAMVVSLDYDPTGIIFPFAVTAAWGRWNKTACGDELSKALIVEAMEGVYEKLTLQMAANL